MVRSRVLAVIGVVSLAVVIGWSCKSAPSQRPLGLGDVDTGPGSVEYVRRQLEGSWTLERFEMVDTAGQAQPVRAQAKLTYDQYGNMTVAGNLLEPLPGQEQATHGMLAYSGRIVIDTAKHEFRLRAQEGVADPALNPSVGAELVRKYEITTNQLTLTFVDAQGKTTARAIFRRGS